VETSNTKIETMKKKKKVKRGAEAGADAGEMQHMTASS